MKAQRFYGIMRIAATFPNGSNWDSRTFWSVLSSIPPMNKVVMLMFSGAAGILNSFILSYIFLASGSLTPLNLSFILSSSFPWPFCIPFRSSSVMLSCLYGQALPRLHFPYTKKLHTCDWLRLGFLFWLVCLSEIWASDFITSGFLYGKSSFSMEAFILFAQ